MPTTTQVNDLKINKLTKAQYDVAVQSGVIGENEISIITDLDSGQTIQVDTLPTASIDELDNIYQYIGITDQDYTNGYFYRCISDGQNPITYSWTQTNVQPNPVIPDPLPSQTGNAGKFLTTDGTDASWSDKPLVNTATGNFTHNLTILGTPNNGSYSVNIGEGSQASKPNNTAIGSFSKATGNGATSYGRYTTASGDYSVAVGNYTTASGANAIAIGAESVASGSNSIQLGTKGYTNSDANTFKVGNANGNFELMSADGTIPEARLADTTNAQEGQVLTLDGNGNAVWASVAQVPQTMPELTVNDWALDPNTNKMTQIVNVSNVTTNNNVIISPAPNSAEDYADCGILCTAQGTGTLTFTCIVTPTDPITVNVLVI